MHKKIVILLLFENFNTAQNLKNQSKRLNLKHSETGNGYLLLTVDDEVKRFFQDSVWCKKLS